MKNRRAIKKHLINILENKPLSDIKSDLCLYNPQELINPLFLAICRSEEKIRWHAISCFGVVLPWIANQNLEDARIIMRRFLWSLNDESGGIGWGAPESMAEAMVQEEVLRKEYLHMLVSYTKGDGPELCQDGNFLELPQLQRGLLWGLNRVGSLYPDDINAIGVNNELSGYLKSEDSQVRGLALLCIKSLGIKDNLRSEIKMVLNDHSTITFYNDGCFDSFITSELAGELNV